MSFRASIVKSVRFFPLLLLSFAWGCYSRRAGEEDSWRRDPAWPTTPAVSSADVESMTAPVTWNDVLRRFGEGGVLGGGSLSLYYLSKESRQGRYDFWFLFHTPDRLCLADLRLICASYTEPLQAEGVVVWPKEYEGKALGAFLKKWEAKRLLHL